MKKYILVLLTNIFLFCAYSQTKVGFEFAPNGLGINGIYKKNMASIKFLPVSEEIKLTAGYYREIARKDEFANGYIGGVFTINNANEGAKSFNLPARLQITALNWIQLYVEAGPSVFEEVSSGGIYDQGVYYTWTDREWKFGAFGSFGVCLYVLNK